MNKMNEVYMIIGRGNTSRNISQLLQIQTALLLGYKVKIITPQDYTCRGRRANNIIWYDEDEDIFKVKELNLPLDKPLEP